MTRDTGTVREVERAVEPAKAQAGVTGHARAWQGVIRVDGKVVWNCGHTHTNRDNWGSWNGKSARSCARGVLYHATSSADEFAKVKAYAHSGTPALLCDVRRAEPLRAMFVETAP